MHGQLACERVRSSFRSPCELIAVGSFYAVPGVSEGGVVAIGQANDPQSVHRRQASGTHMKTSTIWDAIGASLPAPMARIRRRWVEAGMRRLEALKRVPAISPSGCRSVETSVFARRCSRETATLAEWITSASTPAHVTTVPAKIDPAWLRRQGQSAGSSDRPLLLCCATARSLASVLVHQFQDSLSADLKL